MEGNYQPGFYSTERDQQESRHQPSLPSQQQQQQRQQHAAHYPLELPIPYYTTPQHQAEFAVDQPHRAFMFPGADSFHDFGPMLPNSNIVHHAYQHPPVIFRGCGVKSTPSVNHAPPITTPDSAVASNIPTTTTYEPVTERTIRPISTHKSALESSISVVTTPESIIKGNASESQGQTPITSSTSKQLQDNNQREQSSPSSHLTSESPPAPSTSSEEPPIFAALNLKKTNSIQDLPSSLSCRVKSKDKVQGVVAKGTLEKGVEFGPYTGPLLKEDLGWSKETTWEICISGEVFFYIDGHKTWMAHLRCAQSEEEQNMEAYQYYGKIYFRSTKVIEPGSELRVFYSEDYGKHVGIKTRLQDLKFNQDSQKFQCSQCGGLFTSAKLILRHIRCEHVNCKPDKIAPVQKKTKKKFVGIKVSSKQLLKKKKKPNNLEESLFKCGTCEKVFTSCGRLKAHEIFHEYNQDHTCPVCGKRQKNAQTWAKHMMTHKPVQEARPHKCNECNGRYKSKTALRKHEHQIHGYPCRFCSERFSKKKDCQKHERTHQSFISTHSATAHIAEPEPDEPKDMLGKPATYYLKQRPFKCKFCLKTYLSRNDANNHEREMHFGDLAFNCSHCPKSFGSEAFLLEHLINHEQNRMYRCTLCPRSFRSESAFNNHQGEHTGLKPFKCEICGRGFRVKKAVYEHKRRMHRERQMRFFCSVCNKGFADNGNLIKHERRHKGVRPFVCLDCGKGFTAKNSLKTHIQCVHKEEKPFSCEICGKKFSLNDYYTQHMLKHKLQGDGNVGNIIQE